MSKFKIPSLQSMRDRIASRVSQGKGNKDALMAVDYSLAHPSSLEEAKAQSWGRTPEKEETTKKNS